MSYLIINKRNMFSKFEFIAWLVEKGEVVFSYEERKPKVIKKDEFDEFNFGNKANPLKANKQYSTKGWLRDKEYRSSKFAADETNTPAYKRLKFTSRGKWATKTTNKKWNAGLWYKKR